MSCCNTWDTVVIINNKMKKRRRQCGQIALLVTGILLIALGTSIFVYFESIYDWILRDALKFTPTSPTYMAWRTNDPPLIMDVYMFNWTNPDQINNASVKPNFEEVGPYRFKEIKEKVNITWHDNKTISYLQKLHYFFDKENSERDWHDVITTINMIPLTISYKMRFQNFWNKKIVSFGLTTLSKLHVTKVAKEILFDGYVDPILTMLSSLPIDVQDKFGLFYGKNNTIQPDTFSMSYETDDDFGKLISWNYKNQTDFFNGHCNAIRGSSGEFYPINRQKDKLVLYSSQLCKYAELEFEEEVVIKGIKGYKFSGDRIFDNGSTRPENYCFCTGECIPSGVFNVSSCRNGSPSFLSLPHFFGADPSYREGIEGMHPRRDMHEFYIIVEPKSGIIMDIGARMQLNMLLQPIKYMGLYENVPKIFVPVFYFTQHVGLEDDVANSLRLIQNMPEYANYTVLILISLGLILVGWGLCFCCCSRTTKLKIEESKFQSANGTVYQEVPMTEKP